MKVLSRVDLSGMRCEAVVSDEPTPVYRFQNSWVWEPKFPSLYFCGLNPSTASHEVSDPTWTGMMKRARQWGYGGLVGVNLHAIRLTDSRELKHVRLPTGLPYNDDIIRIALKKADNDGSPFIAGWGREGKLWARDMMVIRIAKAMKVPLWAFVINDDGTPKHPLYVKHDVRPVKWIG